MDDNGQYMIPVEYTLHPRVIDVDKDINLHCEKSAFTPTC
jgi:hypothetical protein